MEALTSRSRTELQHLQVHSRTLSVNSLLIAPQTEQVFDDGSKRPIVNMFLPYHSALYSSIETNIPQETSVIACDKQWFLSIPATFKSSMQILSWFLISSLEVLCKKSLRLFDTFSCAKAKECFVRFPLYFENLRERYFNFDCALRKCFSFSKTTPLEATKNDLIPKSIPTVVFSVIGAFLGASVLVSTNIETKYLFVGVLLTVALLITPLISRCKTILMPFLNFGIMSKSFSTITFCGTGKEPLSDFFLNLGKAFCALKNNLKALSILVIDCCKDWLFTSFNHSNLVFNSGKCFIKSKFDKLTLVPAYVDVFASKDKLYTKRQEPICFAIKTFWVSVGYILYFKPLNIEQRYIIFRQKANNVKDNLIVFINNVSVTSIAYIPTAKDRWVLRSLL